MYNLTLFLSLVFLVGFGISFLGINALLGLKEVILELFKAKNSKNKKSSNYNPNYNLEQSEDELFIQDIIIKQQYIIRLFVISCFILIFGVYNLLPLFISHPNFYLRISITLLFMLGYILSGVISFWLIYFALDIKKKSLNLDFNLEEVKDFVLGIDRWSYLGKSLWDLYLRDLDIKSMLMYRVGSLGGVILLGVSLILASLFALIFKDGYIFKQILFLAFGLGIFWGISFVKIINELIDYCIQFDMPFSLLLIYYIYYKIGLGELCVHIVYLLGSLIKKDVLLARLFDKDLFEEDIYKVLGVFQFYGSIFLCSICLGELIFIDNNFRNLLLNQNMDYWILVLVFYPLLIIGLSLLVGGILVGNGINDSSLKYLDVLDVGFWVGIFLVMLLSFIVNFLIPDLPVCVNSIGFLKGDISFFRIILLGMVLGILALYLPRFSIILSWIIFIGIFIFLFIQEYLFIKIYIIFLGCIAFFIPIILTILRGVNKRLSFNSLWVVSFYKLFILGILFEVSLKLLTHIK